MAWVRIDRRRLFNAAVVASLAVWLLAAAGWARSGGTFVTSWRGSLVCVNVWSTIVRVQTIGNWPTEQRLTWVDESGRRRTAPAEHPLHGLTWLTSSWTEWAGVGVEHSTATLRKRDGTQATGLPLRAITFRWPVLLVPPTILPAVWLTRTLWRRRVARTRGFAVLTPDGTEPVSSAKWTPKN